MFQYWGAIRDTLTGERIDTSSRKEAERISRLLNDAEAGVTPSVPHDRPAFDHYIVSRVDDRLVLRIRSTYSTIVTRAPSRELADRIAELLNRIDPHEGGRDPAVPWSRAMGTVQYLWEPFRRRQ